MAGHVIFVREVLKLRTEFANELNQDGLSPLHIAATRGDVHIIRELLKVGNRLCLVKGKVVEFLLKGDAIDEDLIDVNARNEVGLTPLDILLLVNNEAGDAEIVEILTRSGAARTRGLLSVVVATEDPEPRSDQSNGQDQSRRTWNDLFIGFLKVGNGSHGKTPWLEYFKYKKERDSPADVRNALLVVATLITIATYQAVLQPPGGIWQDDSGSSSSSTGATNNGTTSHKAGQAILGTKSPVSYILFVIFNSLGFFASIRMISMLTSGFPMQMELQVALFALLTTYDTVMSSLTPSTFFNYFFVGLSIFLPVIIKLVSRWVRK
ncbi:hypothetical protein BT93_D1201 [Corymbia citriodora subsp. variegata]|nr:hypothetical protein BT93_D1201 [Corymbia citriodora subsp. variegata]